MSGVRRVRFWDDVHVVAEAGGFSVRLDARPVRVMNDAVLRPVGRTLAEALAAEWRLAGGGKGGVFGAEDFVLNGLAATMQEHVLPAPDAAADRLMGFADGELLCYRARFPDVLAALQAEAWQPWLDWLHATHAIRLRVTAGIIPVAQPEPALATLRQVLGRSSAAVLTGLGVVVPGLGSLVLGLALAERRLDAAEAVALARLDERFQTSHWGMDREAEAQAARLQVDIALAARFMTLADG